MKSNVCELNKEVGSLSNMLNEVEHFTKVNRLRDKEALRIRLLAEELRGMLPSIAENFCGEFWIENEGHLYELHATFMVDEISLEKRDKLIAISKSGKNEAAKGIMGKIRAVAEEMILAISDPNANIFNSLNSYNIYPTHMGYVYVDPFLVVENGYICSWSLDNYKNNIKKAKAKENAKEEFEELEHSIVANLADDILVGVKGKNVEIVIKKAI
jgi:hypothetical protein